MELTHSVVVSSVKREPPQLNYNRSVDESKRRPPLERRRELCIAADVEELSLKKSSSLAEAYRRREFVGPNNLKLFFNLSTLAASASTGLWIY